MIRADDEEEATVVPPTEASRVASHGVAFLLPREFLDLVPILHNDPVAGADAESIDPSDTPVIELALSAERKGSVSSGRLYIHDRDDGQQLPEVRRLFNRLVRVINGWTRIPESKRAYVGPDTERRVRAGELTLDDFGVPVSLEGH